MAPRVSIVTINFNQAAVTEALLESLRHISFGSFEVLVVDNGSASADLERLAARQDPRVRLIVNGYNAGFTGGNNRGILEAAGEYVLLLNNDTEVDPGFLEPLVEALDSDPQVGIVSPKIRFHHSPDVIQYAGGLPVSPYTGRGALLGFGETDRGQHDRGGPTHFAHGAAMLIRREVFQAIGLLEDAFFIYYEELDFSQRARRAGFEIRYVPASLVLHKESMTTGRESPFKTYYMTRNRLLFLRRNVEMPDLFLALLFFALISTPVNLLRHLVRRRLDLAGAFARGASWHLGLGRRPGSGPKTTTSSRLAGGVA